MLLAAVHSIVKHPNNKQIDCMYLRGHDATRDGYLTTPNQLQG